MVVVKTHTGRDTANRTATGCIANCTKKMYSTKNFFRNLSVLLSQPPHPCKKHAGAVRSRGYDNSPNCLASQKPPLKLFPEQFLHAALFAPDCARSLSATPTFFVGLVPRPTNGLLRRRCPHFASREPDP